jgi:hypothetical protein
MATTTVLQQNQFKWTESAQVTFEVFKISCMTTTILFCNYLAFTNHLRVKLIPMATTTCMCIVHLSPPLLRSHGTYVLLIPWFNAQLLS